MATSRRCRCPPTSTRSSSSISSSPSWPRSRLAVGSFSGLRLYLNDTKYRDPDLLLLLDANDPRNQDRYWHGADLVLEVVSPDDPERDLVVKRRDYAGAGIPEYWIVNPLDETIAVLALRDGTYVEHGVFARGQRATSVLIPGFSVAVGAVFDVR